MKNRAWKSIAAVVLAGLMTASMGMGVMADGPAKNVTIKKELTKEANVYAPNTTFNFVVAPGTAGETADGMPIFAGVADAVTVAGGITSAPNDTSLNATTVQVGETQLVINSAAFADKEPGIYRYVVTETKGDYEGITYSTESKIFDVYVNSDHVPYTYMFVDAAAQNGKDDGVFTNSYDADKTNTLTVKKEVTGDLGNLSKAFTFTILVNGADDEQYYVEYGENKTRTLTSGTAETVELTNGQSAKIYGLTSGDTYTVTETDYKDEGYKTTIDGEETNTTTGNITADTTITVVNDRSTTAPTGIVMDIAPYILMVAAAGVLAFVFLRRRNYAK